MTEGTTFLRMRNKIPVLVALLAVPATASAEIILKNKDRKPYEVAIRHSVATKTMTIPAGSYLIVSEEALTVQLRDSAGNPKSEPLEVTDGDRIEVRAGKLVKKPSDAVAAE